MTLAEALAVFGVGEVPDAETLAQLYRVKTKAAHPDAGGSAEAMTELTKARDVLASAEPGDSGRVKCPACKGAGVVMSSWPNSADCARCGGSGWAKGGSLFKNA